MTTRNRWRLLMLTILAAGAVAFGLTAGSAGAQVAGGDFDMTVTASDGGATATAGDTLVYTLAYENLGTDQANQVFLSIQVPDHTTAALGASSPGWMCSPDGGPARANCTVQVGDVLGGAGGSATFAVRVADSLPPDVQAILFYVGCDDEMNLDCVIQSPGVFVGGSPFPETDYSNNVAKVITPVGTPCGVGAFSATGLEPCQDAPAGTFVDTTGATAASPCPVGAFQPLAGSTECQLAPIGTYVDITGAIVATACPAGTSTVNIGSASAAACLVDTDRDGLPDVVDPDDDGDGVLDGDDLCAGTDLAGDTAPAQLKRNRFWSDGAGAFGESGWTIADTGGCSASQIIDAADLGRGHTRFGLTNSALGDWVSSI